MLLLVLVYHVDNRLLMSSRSSHHVDTWKDSALAGLWSWFVEAGEDGEGEGVGREDENKANLDE